MFYQDATIGPCVDVQFIDTPIKVSSGEVMTEGWEVLYDRQHIEVHITQCMLIIVDNDVFVNIISGD